MGSALEVRRALYAPGQMTWPEPELRKICAECAAFVPAGKTRQGEPQGRCRRAAAALGKQSLLFKAVATACPKFEDTSK